MDILKYEPVVHKTLSEMNVKRTQKEEFVQECFVALLEKSEELQNAEDDLALAAQICKSRFIKARDAEIWFKKTVSHPEGARRLTKIESLDEPRIFHEAMKLSAAPQEGISETELQEAILSLPLDQYRVIYSLYIDGKTQEKTAAELGLTRNIVRTLAARGIKSLKKVFEV